jgi:hypothetical protein
MKSHSPDREYLIGFSAWMVAYAALLMLSILIIREQSPQGLVLYALAVSPSLPIGGTIWQVLRYMDRSDEYVRAIVTRRFVLATGVTLFLCTAWGFLESNAGLPHVDLYLVYPLFWGSFGVASAFVRQAA